MRKTLYFALAIIACSLVSCQKPDAFVDVEETPITFSANIDKTKTSIASDGKISWVAGDEITVTRTSDNATATYTADSNGASTSFTYSSGTVFTDESVEYSATYGDIDNQTYSATGANCPMSAPAITGTNFSFTESAGMLKFNIKADDVSVATVKAAGKTLTCSPAVVLNTETGTDFYLAIPAGTYSKLAFTFTASDGKKCTKSLKNPLVLGVNHIQPVNLSTALVFSEPPAEVVTYYDKDGNVIANPILEGELKNTGFTANCNNGVSDFKVAFSSGNSNAIDFANGDVVEAKILYKVSNYAFTIGDGNLVPDYCSLTFYTNGSNDWWRVENANSYINPVREVFFDAPVIARLSGTYGLQCYYSSTGQFEQVLAPSNEYLAAILALGTTNPFYWGLYLPEGKYASATYEYFKVTRGGAPISVTGVSLNHTSETLALGGENLALTATVSPAEATNKTISWSTSDASVATVSNGLVTPVSEGTATITVYTKDGDYSASCTVTVQAVHVTDISVASSKTISIGQNYTLAATVSPSNATDDSLVWSSDDTSVATVDPSTGEVTGVAEGNCNITATSVSDPGVYGTCSLTVSAGPAPANEVILLENFNTSTSKIDTISVDIIASGDPTDEQICFANGDYLEMKISKKEIPSSDHDFIYIFTNNGATPNICVISHPSKSNQLYFIPGGWWSSATIQNIEVDVPVYFRFGLKADGTTGSGSYSTDGVNWATFTAKEGDIESLWTTMISSTRSPLKIATARAVGNLQLSTYDYIKIVRGN